MGNIERWTLAGRSVPLPDGPVIVTAVSGPWVPYGERIEVVRASDFEGAVDDRDRLQRAIDRAYEAAHEMDHDAQQALVCVLEWLDPAVSGGQ